MSQEEKSPLHTRSGEGFTLYCSTLFILNQNIDNMMTAMRVQAGSRRAIGHPSASASRSRAVVVRAAVSVPSEVGIFVMIYT